LSVTVTPTPEIENVVTEICSEDFFNVKPINGGGASASDIVPANTVYTWTVDDNQNVTGDLDEPSFQSVITQQLVNLTNEAQVVVYTVTPYADGDGNCPGDTFEIRVTVQPKPTIGNKTAPEICSNGDLNFVAVNGEDNDIVPLGTKYTWIIKTNNTNITGQLAENTPQDRVIQTLRNLTIVPQTIIYEVTPIYSNCAGEPFELSVTVTPTPEISPKQQLICSDDTFDLNFIHGQNGDIIPVGTKYTWTFLTNPKIIGATTETVPQNSIKINQALVNTGNSPEIIIYQITPISASGCSGTPFSLEITVKDPIVINETISNFNGFGVSCFGGSNGSINPNPSGGKLPGDPLGYTYFWSASNGGAIPVGMINAAELTGIKAGTYQVEISESSGLCFQTKSFVITEPQPIVMTETISNYNDFEISCFGAFDGSIDLDVSGGTGSYTYVWTASNGGEIPVGMQNTNQLTNVPAGTYSVTVIDSNNCEINKVYTLIQPAQLLLSEVVANRRNVLCFGEATGNITALGLGGIKPYTFTLTGTDYIGEAVSLSSGLTNTNLHDFNNLKAGQYILSILDLNGCQKSSTTITITQPNAPLQLSNQVLSNYNGFNVACFGDSNGSINHEINGGTAPYTYLWSGPDGFTSTNLNLSNLKSGTYQLVITDAVNCVLTQSYVLTSPEQLKAETIKQNVLCGGENNGNIFIRNVTGGTGKYQFLWIKDGVGEIKRSFVPENLRNVGPGKYILLITDENFCEYIEIFEITEPSPLVTTLVSKEDNLCFGEAKGKIEINVTGGTAPYEYSWLGPDGFTSTNKDLNNLISGIYQVSITDALLCISTFSVTIEEPSEIIINPTLSMVSCSNGDDGAIAVNINGGVPPYTYSWVGPDGFRSTSKDINKLKAGIYELLITDEIGCKITRTYEITEPLPMVIEVTISDYNGFEISCKGGSDGIIDLNISGGNGNYRVFWEGPGGFRSNLFKIDGLIPGNYEVIVFDDKNCSTNATYSLIAPDELLITLNDININDVSCFEGKDGSILVNINKASVPPYRYELSGNNIFGFPVLDIVQSNNLNHNFTNLRAGTYTLRVTDANGCALSELSGLEVKQPEAPLNFVLEKLDVQCYQANNGAIKVTPTGGSAPYTIRWNNLSESFSLQNLSPGTYTGTLTDSNGCTTTISTTVEEAPIYELQEVVKNISCFGKNDGFIQLNIIGGKSPLKIQWGHGPQEPVLNNLPKGIYSVLITDAEGCVIQKEFVINEPQPLDLLGNVTDALNCDNPNSGSISIIPSGGTPPYIFNWSNGERSQNISGLAAGSYSLELIDAMGCKIIRQFTVIQPKALEMNVSRTTERICNPRGLKSNFNLSISGGIAPYSTNWSRGTITNDGLTMETQELGIFTVTITDSRGCSLTQRFEVVEKDPLIPDFEFSSESYDLHYENLANFNVQFTNSSIGKYKELIWEFGDGSISLDDSPQHRYSKAGTYTVTLKLKDLEGCVVMKTKIITITDFFLEIPNVFTPNNDGVNDFFIPRFKFIKDIHFLIMNKWGELIFEAKDLESFGWDGKYKGANSSVGNYVYKIRFTTLDGRVFERSNVFYLGR
jgi:large repetitive protein